MRLVCAGSAEGVVGELRDPASFDGFSVYAPAGLALEGWGARLAGDREEIAVPAARVRALAGQQGLPPEWLTAFDAMLAAVVPHGWYDAAADTIRAHVVRA